MMGIQIKVDKAPDANEIREEDEECDNEITPLPRDRLAVSSFKTKKESPVKESPIKI